MSEPQKPPKREKVFKWRDPKLANIRALRAVDLWAAGYTQEEIAEKLNCSFNHAVKLLDYAKTKGLMDQYESQIVSELVPKALKVYSEKLDEGDAYVAKDVIDKLVKMGDRQASKEQSAKEQDLQAYIAEKRLEAAAAKRRSKSDIEAEVIEDEDEESTPEAIQEYVQSGTSLPPATGDAALPEARPSEDPSGD